MSPVLEACEVVRSLGGRRVLDGASLALNPARITALLGPSGSGKSTLLRVLAGFDRLEGGRVRADGRDISTPQRCAPPESRGLGVVFQDFALFPHLTALDNVAFGLTHLSKAERRTRALDLLAAAELAERAHAYPHELSGGEQQRVAVARALAREPAAVLMDEPFSNLDGALRRVTRERVMEVLRSSRAAVLLVTHDAEEALSLADDVALMQAGRIIQTAPPEEIYAKPASAAAARLTGDVNVWRGRVSAGRLRTPFGDVASDLPEGAQAEALVRPESVQLSTGGSAEVIARRALGAAVELDIRAGEAVWRVREGYACICQPGDAVSPCIDARLASVAAVEAG